MYSNVYHRNFSIRSAGFCLEPSRFGFAAERVYNDTVSNTNYYSTKLQITTNMASSINTHDTTYVQLQDNHPSKADSRSQSQSTQYSDVWRPSTAGTSTTFLSFHIHYVVRRLRKACIKGSDRDRPRYRADASNANWPRAPSCWLPGPRRRAGLAPAAPGD